LLGLTVTLAVPLWPQRPASPAFEEEATEAREANQLEEAVARYREGLKLRPSWKEGSWYLGMSL
jgi:hypothetical protein